MAAIIDGRKLLLLQETSYLRNILHSYNPDPSDENSDIRDVISQQEITLRDLEENFLVQLTNVEQDMKMNTIRIFGVDEQSGEDLIKTVLDIFQGQLKLYIREFEIVSCYRDGSSKDGKPRSIVVEFAWDNPYQLVMKHKHIFKSASTEIVPELCRERRKICSEARKLYGRKRVSVEDGGIMISLPGKSPERILTSHQFDCFNRNNRHASLEQTPAGEEI